MTNLHLSCNENVTNSLILDDKFVKSSLMVHLWWRKLVSVTKILVYFKLMTKFHESSQNGNYSMTFLTSVITIFVTDAHISCSGQRRAGAGRARPGTPRSGGHLHAVADFLRTPAHLEWFPSHQSSPPNIRLARTSSHRARKKPQENHSHRRVARAFGWLLASGWLGCGRLPAFLNVGRLPAHRAGSK